MPSNHSQREVTEWLAALASGALDLAADNMGLASAALAYLSPAPAPPPKHPPPQAHPAAPAARQSVATLHALRTDAFGHRDGARHRQHAERRRARATDRPCEQDLGRHPLTVRRPTGFDFVGLSLAAVERGGR